MMLAGELAECQQKNDLYIGSHSGALLFLLYFFLYFNFSFGFQRLTVNSLGEFFLLLNFFFFFSSELLLLLLL